MDTVGSKFPNRYVDLRQQDQGSETKTKPRPNTIETVTRLRPRKTGHKTSSSSKVLCVRAAQLHCDEA